MKTPASINDTAFSAEQAALDYPEGAEYNYWYMARNKHLLEQIKKHCPSDVPVLEVGCGRGIVVNYLRDHGMDCKGCDIAAISLNEQQKEYIFSECEASQINADYRMRVEVILLLDVLEHFEDPVSFIKELTRHFPKLRYLVLSLPARKELQSNYDEFFGHFRRYDRRMVRSLLDELNAKQLCLHYFFKLLYLPGLLTVKLLGKRKLGIRVPRTSVGKFLHQRIAWKISIIDKMLPGNFPGSSILAICELTNPSGVKSC